MNTLTLKHSLPGRLRVKLSSVKNSPSTAADVEKTLNAHRAMIQCKASAVTGSVVMEYDPRMATEETFLQLLKEEGYYTGKPQRKNSRSHRTHSGSDNGIAKIIFTKAVEIAAERVILALL